MIFLRNPFFLFWISFVFVAVAHSKTNAPDFRTLSNGVRFIGIPDDGLPLAGMGIWFSAGSATDPFARRGLTSATLDLMLKGSESRSAKEMRDQAAAFGGEWAVTVEPDYSGISLTGTSSQPTALAELFFETVLAPRFDKIEIEKWRADRVTELTAQQDEPSALADRFWSRFLFGSHPYGRSPRGTIRDVQSLDRLQIKGRHQELLARAEIVTVWGKWEPEVWEKLRDRVGSWGGRLAQAIPELPRVPPENLLKSRLIPQSDSKQIQIRIGGIGPTLTQSDYPAFWAALSVLGKDFGSRLVTRLREDKGLVYDVDANHWPLSQSGYFEISTFADSGRIATILNEITSQITQFVENGPTGVELADVKRLLAFAMEKAQERPQDQLAWIAGQILRGRKVEDFSRDLSRLRELRRDEVHEAAKKYLKPSKLKFLATGPAFDDETLAVFRKWGLVEIRSPMDAL